MCDYMGLILFRGVISLRDKDFPMSKLRLSYDPDCRQRTLGLGRSGQWALSPLLRAACE
jgi:hypothetical protein